MSSGSGSGGVGLRSERGPVLLAIMLSTGLIAVDSTILATAVPSIVSNLGGFSSFPWLFSIYLLAQAVSVPVYGKLADLFGRKPLILFGIGLFLIGSILCGAAWNMGVLIVFRAVQGLGAGAIAPMSMTILGDLYSVAERSIVQGYVAGVWAVASVLGPTVGGLFTEYISWRWIFFVNIPLCLLATFMLVRRFHETVERSKPRIDYAGALLLTSGSTLAILAVLEGGRSWAWLSASGVAIPATAAVLLVAFVFVEQRSAEPVLPLWVFRHRLLVSGAVATLAVGAILVGLTAYVPTYVQDVLGTGPLVAGLAVGALTLGWPISASLAGQIYLRVGFRMCALIGSVIALFGCGLLLLLDASSSVVQVAATCFVIGLGMGLVASPVLVAAQSSVGWRERGVVTGINGFSRSTGSAVGVAIFGAVVNATIGADTPSSHPDPSARAALTLASQHVFLGVLIVAAGMLAAVVCMPHQVRDPNAETVIIVAD